MSGSERYVQIKTAMLLHMPFFASLLLDLMNVKVGKFPEKFGPMTPTAATDGRTIFFDEDWLATLKLPEAVFVTAHEIGHAMWEHMPRAKRYVDLGFDGEEFQPQLYNIAADYVINDMLVKCGMTMPQAVNPQTGKMEQMGLLDPKYTCDMSVEEVYRLLRKEQKKCKGGKAPGDGSGGNPGDKEGFDKHIYESATLSPAEVKRAIQSAVDAAKACGNLPAGLKRFADEMLDSKIPWQERLRHVVTTRLQRETSTWTMPHRRRLTAQGIYLARPSSFGCGTVVWVFDTSGSIGQKELNQFFAEGADIMRSCRPEKVILIGCDAAVASVQEFDGNEELTLDMIEVKGGGGTDFKPPFQWLEDHGIVPDALIYFTDMMGPFPSDPGYTTIWAATTDTAAPFGELVRIDM